MEYWKAFICIFYFISTLSVYSFGSYETPAPKPYVYAVNDTCLNCICQAISNCDKSWYCVKDVCGMFRMTLGYWIDGGNHTITGDDPTCFNAYQNCANDEICARKTCFDYLTRYATDCDGNNVIDCYDYAGMHKWGPFAGGCKDHPIKNSGSYYQSLQKCLCASNTNNIGNF